MFVTRNIWSKLLIGTKSRDSIGSVKINFIIVVILDVVVVVVVVDVVDYGEGANC